MLHLTANLLKDHKVCILILLSIRQLDEEFIVKKKSDNNRDNLYPLHSPFSVLLCP